MTEQQQRIVEENMGLVGKVIRDKVHGLGQPGVPEYEELFQTGCIGLCKAALTDKGGCFSTYAYRLIWNEICDELVRNTKLTAEQAASESMAIFADTSLHTNHLDRSDLQHIIQQSKINAPEGISKGIRCLELSVHGYTSKEIAAMIRADAGTVRMSMTRARKYLSAIPELQQFAEGL